MKLVEQNFWLTLVRTYMRASKWFTQKKNTFIQKAKKKLNYQRNFHIIFFISSTFTSASLIRFYLLKESINFHLKFSHILTQIFNWILNFLLRTHTHTKN